MIYKKTAIDDSLKLLLRRILTQSNIYDEAFS